MINFNALFIFFLLKEFTKIRLFFSTDKIFLQRLIKKLYLWTFFLIKEGLC